MQELLMSDDEATHCFGDAQPGDRNFADIIAIDGGIGEYLARRERSVLHDKSEKPPTI
jgi:hypothetical protein